MTTSLPDVPNADSSSEMDCISDPRYLDIDRKQYRLADFLDRHSYDAVILQNPWNFQWFTSGGSNETPDGRRIASLYVSRSTRVVLTSDADSPWIFETQIPQLGFYSKERSWVESPDLLPMELCRGRRVVSDSGVAGTRNIDEEIQSLRLRLTHREQALARTLGQDLARSVERSALKLKPGQTELEVVGALSHRMLALGIEPLGIRVNGDGRNERYRQAQPRPKRIQSYCTVAATGRRDGICLTVSRMICHQKPEAALDRAYQIAVSCQATGQYFSQKEWSLEEIWSRVQRIYKKLGVPDEWRRNEQGEILAHRSCEQRIVPHSPFRLEPGMLIHWKPQVGPVSLSDTFLVTDEGPEWLTKSNHWPVLKVEVKGEPVFRPELVVF